MFVCVVQVPGRRRADKNASTLHIFEPVLNKPCCKSIGNNQVLTMKIVLRRSPTPLLCCPMVSRFLLFGAITVLTQVNTQIANCRELPMMSQCLKSFDLFWTVFLSQKIMSLVTAIRQRGHLTISSALLWHKSGVSLLSRNCLSNGVTLLISSFPCNSQS